MHPTPVMDTRADLTCLFFFQTPVGQPDYFVHRDPSIFPDPDKFDPDHWIRAGEKNINLKSFLVSFSKGSRQCIGIK